MRSCCTLSKSGVFLFLDDDEELFDAAAPLNEPSKLTDLIHKSELKSSARPSFDFDI